MTEYEARLDRDSLDDISKASTTGQTDYRVVNLELNDLFFLDYTDFIATEALKGFRGKVQGLLDLARSRITLNPTSISTTSAAKLEALADHLEVDHCGYSDSAIIDQAVQLRLKLRKLSSANEDDWIVSLTEQVWNFFSLFETFSYSTGAVLWYKTEPAILQLIPNRSLLKRAKPDLALGMKFNSRALLHKMLSWPQCVVPSVNLRVSSTLSVPFFIFESKADSGSLRQAENRLANSMLKAHDVLCSLNLSESLYILGAIQYRFFLNLYVSFAVCTTDEDGKRYCQAVYIVKIKTCELDDVHGCLHFLLFVDYIKRYGSTTFQDEVEASILRFAG